MALLFCNLESARRFHGRNSSALEIANRTHDLFEGMIKQAVHTADGSVQVMTWLLGASCLKEFEEILLLAGNGFGTGATKLMRSFYERVVTMSYLAAHSDQVQKFFDYSAVHWHKLLVEADEIHGSGTVSDEFRKKIEDGYKDVKDLFREEKCPACKRRPPMTWTKVTIQEMAKDVNENIRKMCFEAYLKPTFFMHATSWGMENQFQKDDNGKRIFFGTKIQEEAGQRVFHQSFILLVQALSVLDEVFQLHAIDKVKDLGREWSEAVKLSTKD